MAQSPEVDAAVPAAPEPPKPSLRRELRAILVLYAATSILPILIGLAFG